MMPSGNAIYTYTGPEESTEVQGQIFLKDQPKHITDQGVIAVCAVREDFAEASTYTWVESSVTFTVDHNEAAPAKPKKAKSK